LSSYDVLRNRESPLVGGLTLVNDGLELLDGDADDIVTPKGPRAAGADATAVDMMAICQILLEGD
jgi:hypothetical protein